MANDYLYKKSNTGQPASPTLSNTPEAYSGLTKRELFCLHNGVPATGDKDLDKIIREGNIRKTILAAITSGCNYEFHLEEAVRLQGRMDTLIDEARENRDAN